MLSKYNLDYYLKPVWIPITEPKYDNLVNSKFGGIPLSCKDETWPLCGNCQKPIQLFLQLDSNELTKDLDKNDAFGTGILQLFYCTFDTFHRQHY